MKTHPAFLRIALLFSLSFHCLAGTVRADYDFFDSANDLLKISAFRNSVNIHFSGLVDLEGYYTQTPRPGLIDTNHPFLFNPRITMFVEGQIGQQFYFFAQSRVDRGFDPSDSPVRIGLDEYALRFTPWSDGRFNVQIGKFATVVGNWTNRHDSWENPFITAPLPYENLTSMWDSGPPDSYATLLSWNESDKYLRLPVIWGPSYATGAEVSGRIGKFDYAGEIKNAALSSRPEAWDMTEGFSHPTFSGRLGYRPDEAWNLGFSASTGSYLLPQASASLPPGTGLGDYRSILFGQDLSYAWHHWQFWAEAFETRFEIPGVGNADSLSYYLEAKYKFTPQLFGALRWNQQLFSKVPDVTGGWDEYTWADNQWRIDAAMTYRFTESLQGKLQYSFMRISGDEDAEYRHFVALQLTLRY